MNDHEGLETGFEPTSGSQKLSPDEDGKAYVGYGSRIGRSFLNRRAKSSRSLPPPPAPPDGTGIASLLGLLDSLCSIEPPQHIRPDGDTMLSYTVYSLRGSKYP